MVRDFSYFEVKIADKKFEIQDGNTTAQTAIIKFFNDTNEILSTNELGYVSANEIYRLIELGGKVHFQECYIEDFSLTDYRKNHPLLKNEIIRILGFTATHSIFHSDKELNFSFSKFIKGDVDFTNSIFLKGSLLFENCSFGNINVSFENVLFRDGNVNFGEISGSFYKAKLRSLIFDSCHLNGYFNLEFQKCRSLKMPNTVVRDILDIKSSE
jgi:hypothetical protein